VLTAGRALAMLAVGASAGGVGALLGIGGGVFLVPLLNVVFGIPLRNAAAISLTTVVATSSTVAAGRIGTQLINLRLAMVLEVATVAGGLTGGLTAHRFSESVLQRTFGVVALLAAAGVGSRLNRRNVILDATVDVGRLGGRFYEEESGGQIAYRVKRLPVALLASFAAGTISSLLGVGGGIVKVPALNAWCGVPLRAAAATSAFMIGVTATSGAIIYFGRGDLSPLAAAPVVLGVQVGSWLGLRFVERIPARWLKIALASVLIAVSAIMFARSL
jgi:uncharacterized protein